MVNAFDLYFFQIVPNLHVTYLEILTFCADPKMNLFFWGAISLFYLFRKKSLAIVSKPFYFFVLTNLIMLSCGLLKIFVGRARPFLIDENIAGFYFLSVKHAFLSFPSSHTAISAAFAYTYRHFFALTRWIYLYPVMIMGTRLSLREHFATDVLAGFGIGLCLSIFLAKIYPKLSERVFAKLQSE